MKGMIFAAGVGSRLRPFTDEHPKALAPVGGIPMLRRVIEKMTEAGISRIVVNVHHFPQQIVSYLEENDNFGADISVSDESAELLDTGGGLLHARRFLDGDEPVLVHNADILTDFDISRMARAHSDSGALATLLAGLVLKNEAADDKSRVDIGGGRMI
ncbi:MAG: NTP transferase domain-containing protein, partial [Muribaculaceae bacterium]|nr:NTP transferase domain-containing protein [Muribaculaceae bacterium]